MILTLESNISSVLAEFSRVENGFNAALARSVQPQSWFVVARETALATLLELARSKEEQAAARAMAQSVTTAAFGDVGMEWTLDAARQDVVNIFDTFTREDLPLFQFQKENLSAEIVEDWVRHAKKITERDQTKDGDVDYDMVTRRILAILFGKREGVNRSRVAQDLLFGKTGASGPSIMEHALAKGELAGLNDEKIGQWLDAVVKTWADVILAMVPERILAEWDLLVH